MKGIALVTGHDIYIAKDKYYISFMLKTVAITHTSNTNKMRRYEQDPGLIPHTLQTLSKTWDHNWTCTSYLHALKPWSREDTGPMYCVCPRFYLHDLTSHNVICNMPSYIVVQWTWHANMCNTHAVTSLGTYQLIIRIYMAWMLHVHAIRCSASTAYNNVFICDSITIAL